MPIIKLKDNESFDSGLRRFKRSCDKAGIISEIRKREFYEKPTSVRKRKAAAAVKRQAKRRKFGKMPPLRARVKMSIDLKSLIKTQVTISMKDGDKFRTTVLRMILADIQKIEIEEKSDLDELQITSILEKMIKQRNDAIAQFEQAKRQELADKEKQEIEIIREFLPEQMSEEEVSELVSKIISEVGAQDMKDMGLVMGSLKPLIAGKADAGVVSQLVKKALS